ncbi:hypothetical protein [Paraburkholderia youngii]|uniref:hypothetical protein n=1 Tax=Paraburkholderia youngii TaxID=2782701 RepID=UPI0020D156DD|nr:hypothetical protein [Paraburkholderia youngii]
MIKFILRVFASLAVALALEPGVAIAATPDSPETTVKAFYTWYLQQGGSVYQLTDSHIYNYVRNQPSIICGTTIAISACRAVRTISREYKTSIHKYGSKR